MAQQTLTPEILVPRLGEYLVQRGHISEEDLQRALVYQREKTDSDQSCLLGEALLKLKLVKRGTLNRAITEQIIQLRNALEDANRFLEHRVQERTAELQEALRRLSELNQLKANFIANVSHELRTPLTHLKGYVELLVTESLGPLSPEQKDALQVSQRAASRLENLIDNLILFSLATRGEISLRLEPLNLNKVISEVIKYTRSKASDRQIVLNVDIKPDLPPVMADREKISWVILQLLDNAVKFTAPGGQVTLSVQLEANALVMVSVVDAGIGISPNRLEELFVPFHQLDSSSTRRYSGTGIGLALVREILNAHGSMIEVESQVGKGSTFHFQLVVAEQHP